MAIIQGNAKKSTATGGFYPKVINGSLRFNDDDVAYLSWTPTSAGNRKTWTFSCWVKRGDVSNASNEIFGTAAEGDKLAFGDSRIFWFQNGSASSYLSTSALFRDPSAWYHIVFALDTTQATPANRCKLWVNGESVAFDNNTTFPTQNYDGDINNTEVNFIGRGHSGDSGTFDGYLANVHFLNGIAATADDFGELKNGVWVAKDYEGLFDSAAETALGHANGFYLTFEDDVEVEAFNTLIWSGDSSTSRDITGTGFAPDFVWIKDRNTARGSVLFDVIRGQGNYLRTNETTQESTSATPILTAFNSDGFTLGNNAAVNNSNETYVAWCWKAGGSSNTYNVDGTGYATTSAAGITDGTLPLTGLSVSTTYGFSICTFNSGASGTQTFAHGLGTTPSLCIFKEKDSGGAGDHWVVWEGMTGNPATSYGYLNLTNGFGTDTSQWSNTAPTSTTFTFNSGYAWSTSQNMIAYCWAEKSGYSAFGSFSGSGATDQTIYTTDDKTSTGANGFKPAFILIKRTNAGYDWTIIDNTRDTVAPHTAALYPNLSFAEYSGSEFGITFNSDGFTLNGDSPSINASGGTYIYAAFADTREAAFWLDQSGNDNDWQPVNLDHNDTVADSPTNNFCVMNPINPEGDAPLSDGNLVVGSTTDNYSLGTMLIPSTGKWYFEGTVEQVNFLALGIQMANAQVADGAVSRDENIVYSSNGKLYGPNDTSVTYANTYTVNDVIGVAVNMDDGEMTFYKNNVSQGTLDSTDFAYDIRDYDWVAKFGSYNANGRWRVNFGQSGFTYTPPSGHLALSTANLPDPVIDPAQGASPEDYFNTVLYTGNGSTQSIDVGFATDFTWIKWRDGTGSNQIYDTVRGATNRLRLDRELAEDIKTNGLTSFDPDGFTVGDQLGVNALDDLHVAWNWKSNGSGVSNTVGDIASTVSANTTSGFSIVSYTGDTTTTPVTVGHGLSQKPEMILFKRRTGSSTANWNVYHEAIGATARLKINLTDASQTTSAPFNDTEPTNTVFTVNTSTNVNPDGDDVIAYCFHSVEGFSKIGSYTGNGSSDGPFVYTGFQPAFVLFKKTNITTASWAIRDNTRYTYNPTRNTLYADKPDAEYTGTAHDVDFLSNGFKPRTTDGLFNSSGATYIYMAFAENPFKYSNAR